MDFTLERSWDGKDLKHDAFKIRLEHANVLDDFVTITFSGPYFAEPAPPTNPRGSLDKLWNYEVLEFFFLNDNDCYLEIECSPSGHFLVLLLNGRRNITTQGLPLDLTVIISGNTWQGTVKVPFEYFPPHVTKFNAYAIHLSDPHRHYEALFPATDSAHSEPDFHRLEYFSKIDFAKLRVDNTCESKYWRVMVC